MELCSQINLLMMEQNKKEPVKGFAKMTLDFSFKRVFGNEKDKKALIAFLNRMIEDTEIEDVLLLPTERLGLTSIERKAIFDVFCRSTDGTEFIVEMQCAKQKYFRDRALYYAGYPLVEQGHKAFEKFVSESGNEKSAKKFRWDYNLKPLIFIALLNFEMKHDEGWPENKYYSSYRITEDSNHEIMNDKLRFIFIELGRFTKSIDCLEKITDKWIYALKHMHEFDSRPAELFENEFDALFNLAKIANFTSDEVNSYLNELVMDNDYWNTLVYAREEALQEGRAEGIAEGRAETIKKMLEAGVPVEIIANALGITLEECAAIGR